MIELEELMRRCLQLARAAARSGNFPLGALVAADGKVVAESESSLLGGGIDPSAHPGMVVVRDAANRGRSRYLPGAFLVTTLEPCPMCASVAIWAKMAGIVFGATQQDVRLWSVEHSVNVHPRRQIDLPARAVVMAGVPALELHEGVLRDECRSLFSLALRR